MRVTIVLDTGGFLPRKNRKQNEVMVGYFGTPGVSDIEVTHDGKKEKSTTGWKLLKAANLAKGKKRVNGKKAVKNINTIHVEHLEKNGLLKEQVDRSPWFELDILKKDDLYPKQQIPEFNADAYDCILCFHSGYFHSADVRARRFTEHHLGTDKPTGKDKTTRAIANEIHVEYDIADGEVLRLRTADMTEIWSSELIGDGVARVVVKILGGEELNQNYHKKALHHKAKHYYLPNSDPPPMNGNQGGLTP
jgi:hypothetical protein